MSKDVASRSRVVRTSGGSATVLAILVIVYGSALVLSVFLAFNGQYQIGVSGAILVLVLAPLAFAIVMGRSSGPLVARVDELTRLVRSLTDYAALSDDARRVLSRSNDKEILAQAIEEDIEGKNWDAAMVLVKELADRFGYRSDAEGYRKKIDAARAATSDLEITNAVQYLDGLIIQRRWDVAFADTARLLRLYPDSPRVFGLRARVEQAQHSYRDDLEQRFLAAAQVGNTEEAMLLLKELDGYLTPTQAGPLREIARGVIGKARENLGVQFKLALRDRHWREATRLGERIIGEFPNSRMATEVRDVIDGIRIRASSMQT